VQAFRPALHSGPEGPHYNKTESALAVVGAEVSRQRLRVSGSDRMNAWMDAIWLFSEMNAKSVALT
jgi:hypothetical protein